MREIIGADSRGALHVEREDYLDGSMNSVKRWFAEVTNPERRAGAPADVIDGADLLIGVSGARALPAEALARMNKDAMVFAMANPTPEVSPEEAAPYVRIMATGRSDYPNQINNVLCFPGIFRGALDVRAPAITEEMKMAAARAIAAIVHESELREDYIIPSVFNRDVAPAVAAAVAEQARAAGTALAGQEVGFAQGDMLTGPSRRFPQPAPSSATGGDEAGAGVSAQRVTVTGATGLLGPRLVAALLQRGAQVTVLSRDPARARQRLGEVQALRWDLLGEPAPGRGARGTRRGLAPRGRAGRAALERDAKRAIRESRVTGTRNLLAGLAAAEQRARRADQLLRRSATTARTARSRSTRTPRPARTSWRRFAWNGRPRPTAPPRSACAS